MIKLLFAMLVFVSSCFASVIVVNTGGKLAGGVQVPVIYVGPDGTLVEEYLVYDEQINGFEVVVTGGPNASFFFPQFGWQFLWWNGFWANQAGYYWSNNGTWVQVNNNTWNKNWNNYWNHNWPNKWHNYWQQHRGDKNWAYRNDENWSDHNFNNPGSTLPDTKASINNNANNQNNTPDRRDENAMNESQGQINVDGGGGQQNRPMDFGGGGREGGGGGSRR